MCPVYVRPCARREVPKLGIFGAPQHARPSRVNERKCPYELDRRGGVDVQLNLFMCEHLLTYTLM